MLSLSLHSRMSLYSTILVFLLVFGKTFNFNPNLKRKHNKFLSKKRPKLKTSISPELYVVQ